MIRYCLFVLLLALASPAFAGDGADLVLHGDVTGSDHQHYRRVPFDVPAGTSRITVEFEYTGRDNKTTIDLGLLGPDGFRGRDGFRGWSGGNKQRFTVSASDATPSYLPGPITPGRWSLLLGFPNVRERARDSFTARVWFSRADAPAWEPAVVNPPLRREAGWYRGDLHMHDAHSDGSCLSQSGKRVPCPLFLTVQKAAARQLDFIAITDHNTVSQANAMRELQPYFDRLLLVPGREITTFSGHANLFGTTAMVDFRVGTAEVPDWNALLRAVRPLGGVVSINHPVRPSDETCMGCGWTADPAADPALLQAIEVVNGADADTPYSGIEFWERQLNTGARLTAIGGSDSHDATLQVSTARGGALGMPTTVVHARELSMPAILDGIRAGHVFIDVQGSGDRWMDFTARSGPAQAAMGDTMVVPVGGVVEFTVHTRHVAGARVEVIEDGQAIVPASGLGIERAEHEMRFAWHRDDDKPHWLRVNVRGPDGRLWLLGNPIYVRMRDD